MEAHREPDTHLNVKHLRDTVLVLLRLHTNRRVQDIAALRWGQVHIREHTVVIRWHHISRHPVSDDEVLAPLVGTWLIRYLHALYGCDLDVLSPDTPLWICLRRNQGEMLSTRAITTLYQRHFGSTLLW